MKTLLLIFAGIVGISGIFFMLKKDAKNVKEISDNGLKFIMRREGLSLVQYYDSAGLPTIGYGHLIKAGESFTKITNERAAELLKQDAQLTVIAINQLVKVDLTQGQFDALASFVFNVGIGAFKNSTLLKKLNAGDYTGAKAEFNKWDKITLNGQKVSNTGLAYRRKLESELWGAA